MYFFANLLFVIQHQREFVVSSVQSNRLAGQHEKTFLACFRLVVSGRKIMEGEAPGRVGFRPVGAPGGIFELYLRSCDRNAILIQNHARAICGIRRPSLRGRKQAARNQYCGE